MKTSKSQTEVTKSLPLASKTKTVSFEILAEEYEIIEYAIRTFYVGVFYRSRPMDIHTQAAMLLRRDIADLLEKVPRTRLNYNKPADARTGAKLIPFPKTLPCTLPHSDKPASAPLRR